MTCAEGATDLIGLTMERAIDLLKNGCSTAQEAGTMLESNSCGPEKTVALRHWLITH